MNRFTNFILKYEKEIEFWGLLVSLVVSLDSLYCYFLTKTLDFIYIAICILSINAIHFHWRFTVAGGYKSAESRKDKKTNRRLEQ